MKFAICQELFENWDWKKQCEFSAGLGYTGMELAPFTLAGRIGEVSQETRAEYRKIAEGHGLQIIGLHWLLAKIPLQFDQAVYPQEEEVEEAAVDDEAEGDADELVDEVGAADVEEEEYYHGGGGDAAGGEREKLTDSILDASVAPEAWKIELERVTPALKMQV